MEANTGGQPVAPPTSNCSSGCCGSKPTKQEEKYLPISQQSVISPKQNDLACGRAICAEKNPEGGCCDADGFGFSTDQDSCLDNIAIRECRAECGDKCPRKAEALSRTPSNSSTTSLVSRKDACEYHVQTTRQRYAETLEALGCICRALLARNLESCCSPQPNGSALRQRKSKGVSRTRTPSPPIDSGCCSSGVCSQTSKAIVPKRSIVKKSSCGSNISSKSGCQDGCCGGEKAKEKNYEIPSVILAKKSSSEPVLGKDDQCKKGCCGSKNEDNPPKKTLTKKASAGSSINKKESCAKGCCGSEKASNPIDTTKDTITKKTSCEPDLNNVKTTCASGCCGSTTTAERNVAKAPMKKPSRDSIGSGKNSCVDDCCKGDSKQDNGTSKALIARASFESGKESCKDGCCGPKNQNDKVATRKSSCGSITEAKGGCSDGCCGSGNEKAGDPKKSCDSISIQEDGCADGCCSSAKVAPPAPKKGGCSGDGEDDCCRATTAEKKRDLATYGQGSEIDAEKGPAELEHVVLSVSGMTCTGCETKLSRTLAALPYITNVKTSLALSRAEFDLRASSASVEEAVRHIERTTDFSCQVMTLKGAEIHVIPVGCGVRDFVEKQALPHGVIEMDAVDKETVRIIFDSDVIGARDLMEKELKGIADLAPPRPDPSLSAGSRHVRHVGWMTLLSAVLTIPVLVLAWAPLPDHPVAYGAASLALATIIQVVIAGPFYSSALKTLIFSRMIEMDLLIVLSTSAAYIFSLISFAYIVRGRPLETGSFFETSTLLITLIMVGRFLSAMARQKAVESVSITSLQAPTALLISDGKDGKVEREIDARLLQYGDVFKVPSDSSIVTDGTVISGDSEVDESMITGESMPVEKHPKSRVVAGSTNGSGTLVVRLTRLPGDNTISTIADMVAEARFSKPKTQELADRVASYFVPVVVGLTIITFAIWMGVGIGVRKQTGSQAATQAITYAIAVLIVSCPCAIGLAVPMVIVMASGVSAEHGVIFKTGEVLDNARKVNHVVFDKTGTLTLGNPVVAAEKFLPSTDSKMNEDETLSILLALVSGIKHPVSRAVTEHLTARRIIPSAFVSEARAVPGKGVSGLLNGKIELRAGNSRWLKCASEPAVSELLSRGNTVFCVSIGNSLSAVFGLEDSLRPESVATVTELKRRGVHISIVSGDDEGSVATIAHALGIDPANIKSKQKPEEKQQYIKDLQSSSNKSVVLFCGDGTNDAAALAQASIGVHMSGGTDVARSAADAVLVRPSLEGLLVLMDMSKDSHRRIVFNFSWSFVYNLFAILLAAGAFVRARIPPQYAGLGEVVSVLPVIIVAAHIRMARFGGRTKTGK